MTSSILGLFGQLGLASPVAATPSPDAPRELTVPVEEAPAPAPDVDSPPFDSVLTEARARRTEGVPLAALPPLEDALDRLDPATLQRDPDLRALLLLEQALSLDATFSLDANLEHLHRARDILDRLVAEAEVHGYASVLVDQALSMRDRVDERLSLGAPSSNVALHETAPGQTAPSSTHAGRGWRIAGWTLGGLGLGVGGVSLAGLALGRTATDGIAQTDRPSHESMRLEAIDRGQRSNRLALGTGITACALLTVGVTSVVIGIILRRRTRTSDRSARSTAGRRTNLLGGPS